MSLVKEDNTPLTKTAAQALITTVPEARPRVQVTVPVYELKTPSGTTYPAVQRMLKWHTGQIIYRDEFDAAFPAATIATVSPATGAAAGGTSVTITGSGFTPDSTVKFGANSATNLKVISDGKITCKTPAGSTGAVDVVVTTDAGNVTKTGGFTYTA